MLKKLTFIFAIIFTVIGMSNINAQKVMTLHDCMEYAVAHSTKMKIQHTDMSDAKADWNHAWTDAFTPSLNANTYTAFNFGRAVDPETNTYQSNQTFNNGYALYAQLNIFNGFSAINNIKVARTAMKMGVSQEQQIKDEICLAVMQAYYNVVYTSHMKDVCNEMVTTAEQNVKLIQRQEELGEKSHADVAHLEAELARREYDLIEMTSLYNNAILELKSLMLWQSTDTLNLDLSVTESNDRTQSDYIADSLINKAKNTLPSVRIAKNKMDIARHSKQITFASMLPSLSVSTGWNTSYYTYQGLTTAPFSSQFKNNSGEYVQFSLSIPLFNKLSEHTRYVKAKNEQCRATFEYEQTLRDVENEVTRALQERHQAEAAFVQADLMMISQEEAYNLDKSKMQKGILSPIEFRTSADAFMKAKAERINALLKYYLKRSVVDYYNGISYLEQMN